MEMAHTSTQMGQRMLVNGNTINRTDLGLKCGLTIPNTKAHFWRGRSTERGYATGEMARNIKGNSSTMR